MTNNPYSRQVAHTLYKSLLYFPNNSHFAWKSSFFFFWNPRGKSHWTFHSFSKHCSYLNNSLSFPSFSIKERHNGNCQLRQGNKILQEAKIKGLQQSNCSFVPSLLCRSASIAVKRTPLGPQSPTASTFVWIARQSTETLVFISVLFGIFHFEPFLLLPDPHNSIPGMRTNSCLWKYAQFCVLISSWAEMRRPESSSASTAGLDPPLLYADSIHHFHSLDRREVQ